MSELEVSYDIRSTVEEIKNLKSPIERAAELFEKNTIESILDGLRVRIAPKQSYVFQFISDAAQHALVYSLTGHLTSRLVKELIFFHFEADDVRFKFRVDGIGALHINLRYKNLPFNVGMVDMADRHVLICEQDIGDRRLRYERELARMNGDKQDLQYTEFQRKQLKEYLENITDGLRQVEALTNSLQPLGFGFSRF